jgi:capsular exopolysaccharide synthesis family protein
MREPQHRSQSFVEESSAESRLRDVSSPALTSQANFRSMTLPHHAENCFLRAPYDPRMQAIVEAYHRLRTTLVRNREMRTLVVSSSGTAEGKTSTAFDLALCFANIQDLPVLLVDADLRTKGLSHLLGLPASPGLSEILATGLPYDDAVIRADCGNLHVLPAGVISGPPPELFSREEWKRFIGWSATQFKLVLIDSPPVLRFADFDLIASACENVLLVARERKTNRELLASACAHLDPRKLAGVVYTGVSRQKPRA